MGERTRLSRERLLHDYAEGNERISIDTAGDLQIDNFPILTGESTEFNGHLSVGAGAREALLISDQNPEFSHIYNSVYSQVIQQLQEQIDARQNYKEHVFTSLFDVLHSTFPNRNVKALDSFLEKLHIPDNADAVINLGEFMQAGIGVCRHNVALGAYLLERMHNESWVGGQARIKRSTVPEMGGHAWIEYTNSDGQVIILDPMTNEADLLDNINTMKNAAFYQALYDQEAVPVRTRKDAILPVDDLEEEPTPPPPPPVPLHVRRSIRPRTDH